MPEHRSSNKPDGAEVSPGMGVAAVVVAVVCCAGLPLLVAALASGVALGAVVGVGAGVLAVVALAVVVVLRVRGRHRATDHLGRRRGSARDGRR